MTDKYKELDVCEVDTISRPPTAPSGNARVDGGTIRCSDGTAISKQTQERYRPDGKGVGTGESLGVDTREPKQQPRPLLPPRIM